MRLFAELASTETTQGVIALVRPPVWTLDQLLRGRSLVVVLDGVQDPGNAGAIVRAAEAFGATGAAFLKGAVSPYNPEGSARVGGSMFRLPVVAAVDESLLLAALEQKRVTLVCGDARARRSMARGGSIRALRDRDRKRGARRQSKDRGRATGLRIPTSQRGIAERGGGGGSPVV